MLDVVIAKQIQSILLSARSVLLISDKRADGDSLGSVVALFWYLRARGVKARVFVQQSVPLNIQYLANGVDCFMDDSHIKLDDYDVVVTCDFGSMDQSGIADELLDYRIQEGRTLINIDHHETNSFFGQINVVHSEMSSNTEIVFHLMQIWNAPITPKIATALMTGLVTDTNNFTNAGTTPRAMKVASCLMVCGANMQKIIQNTQRNLNLNTLKLWGRVFLRLRKHPEMDLAVTHLTSRDLDEYDLSYDAVDGVADFLNSLSQTKAVLFLREERGSVKGSFRTTRNDVDVSKIARLLGGGGHRKASGFTVNGSIMETPGGCKIV